MQIFGSSQVFTEKARWKYCGARNAKNINECVKKIINTITVWHHVYLMTVLVQFYSLIICFALFVQWNIKHSDVGLKLNVIDSSVIHLVYETSGIHRFQ